ncbi:MAG TPA: hypothetical protein PK253_18680 [Spirochaetota bacterium]|nr:hypothetical protein [Spirochaetota bacterium]
MKKIKIAIAASTIAMFGLFGAIGCSGGGGGSDAPVAAQDIVNTTGGNNTTSGVSGVPGITVENGNIVVTLTDGNIAINGENLTLAVEDSNGVWQLADGISITVVSNSGATITGAIHVDPDTGVITFRPDSSLDVNETYTITVTVNGVEYQATVVVAVDNTGEENSMFAGVTLRNAGTYAISDLLVNGKAIFGWQFGTNFQIWLTNVEPGATVKLTAYGIYDIEGQENNVYFQRWESDNTPVEDFIWIENTGTSASSTFVITVNPEDSTLDVYNTSGEEPVLVTDYSFATTYFQLTVTKDGDDITATSSVTVNVVETN